MNRIFVFFALFLQVIAVVSAAVNPLGPYKVSDVTVSGLSSGAYMAVQMHIAYSSVVNGSAVFAGGPYYCAEGNLMNAEYKCMKTMNGLPDVTRLIGLTNDFALSGKIDKVENLKDDRVYLFSGTADTVVKSDVMHSLQSYYNVYVQPYNIVADFNVKAEHCLPTLNYGEACATLGSPYIGKCGFDGAGVALKTLYGDLTDATTAVTKNLMTFSQKEFIKTTGTSLADTGYIYVPTACQSGSTCHLHVAFHGCEQTQDLIGNEYADKTGFNTWAEANNIIVLYPYAKRSMSMPSNPNGCWDWWGYTDKHYGNQDGVQMQFVRNLIKEVSSL